MSNLTLPKPANSMMSSTLQSQDISLKSTPVVYFLRPSARHLDEQYFALCDSQIKASHMQHGSQYRRMLVSQFDRAPQTPHFGHLDSS